MVGIVLVSHSRALAEAVQQLVVGVSGQDVPLRVAAGTGETRNEFGTDATEILSSIEAVMSDAGVLVLMDIGSAILSAETAWGFLDDEAQKKVRLCAGPFVEGAVAAAAIAALGSPLDEVAREAERAMHQKTEHFQPSTPKAEVPPSNNITPDKTLRVTVRNPHGLHARPAAQLIREAGKFSASIEVRNATTQSGPTSIKSLTGLAMLEIREGQEIELAASGPDADAALQALKSAIDSCLGETIVNTPAVKAAPIKERREAAPSGIIAVSGGIAIGPLFFAAADNVDLPDGDAADAEVEIQKLESAIVGARQELARGEASMASSLGKDQAAILRAQALVLDDPAILEAAEKAIRNQRFNAAQAWHEAYETAALTYERLSDEYLRQRATDVRDVGRSVLAQLGITRRTIGDPPQPGILVVDDLAPTDVTGLSKEKVLGVILLRGGKTSHAAILLRGRGIPAIARAQEEFAKAGLSHASSGATAAIDGERGGLWLNPDAATQEQLRAQVEKGNATASAEAAHRYERASTSDGRTIPIWANLGQPEEAASALEQGAEGVGLFRTEFLFLHREQAPPEEEQFAALSAVQQAMGARPVIIRTLDVGGDKELPYLGLPREANPFLGVRAIRLCLSHPELFEPHLRAILRAAHGGNFRLMFPMIADPAELAQAREILEAVHSALADANIEHAWPLPLGMMIEVPSAVALIDQFTEQLDFFSIGTNDLTQYVLAADRGNPELAYFQDALHPAVLRQIYAVTTAAHRRGKEVGICGEAAADPDSARIFLGLGVDELSMAPTSIPKIKAAIRTTATRDAEDLAISALALGNAAEVRALLAQTGHDAGQKSG